MSELAGFGVMNYHCVLLIRISLINTSGDVDAVGDLHRGICAISVQFIQTDVKSRLNPVVTTATSCLMLNEIDELLRAQC